MLTNQPNKFFLLPYLRENTRKRQLCQATNTSQKHLEKQEMFFGVENKRRLSSLYIFNFAKRLTTII